MKCFSLFSGIGGFDLAMRNLGHETVGACEIDKYARSVYAKNFPGVPIWEDATKINPKEIPDFEILCAGFPCQAFSIAGKRRGFDDTRGSLFFEIARIVKEKKPSYLLLENVKGLLSHDKGETFRTIIRTLDEVGYDVQWQIINSKYFVPQNRERVFIVGYLRGKGRRKILPIGNYDTKVGGENNLKQLNDTPHDTGRIYHPDGLARSLRANSGGMGSKTGLYAVVNDHGTLKEKEISNNLHPNYWKGMDNHAQRTMITVPVLTPDRLEKRQNGRRFKENGDVSFTLTAQDKHGIFNGTRIRRLTPKECETLQGFPDNFTKYGENSEEISDTQRYKMCGNAVTVPVVQYIMENIS